MGEYGDALSYRTDTAGDFRQDVLGRKIVVYTKKAVIPSERSESRDLRISLRFRVNSVPRSFDYAALRSG